MKFKIDENLPIEIAEILSRAGHDTLTILDEDMGGKPTLKSVGPANTMWQEISRIRLES